MTGAVGRLAKRFLAGFFLVAAWSPVAGAQTLKMATLVPEGSVWDQNARRMGEAWQRDAGVRLRIYPGGVAGDEPDILRKMRIGQIDAAMLTTSGLADIDPAFALFQIPLFFRDDSEVKRAIEVVGPTLASRLEKHGFVLLHWGHAGWLRIFSTERIDNLADFKSLKQFVWGGSSRMVGWYREVGLQAVPLAATDLMAALQTGMIEAFPSTPLTSLSLQWFRSAPNMLEWRFAPLLGATVMSTRSWKKLKEEDREAMLAAAQEAGAWLFQEIPKQEAKAVVGMAERGLTTTKVDVATSPDWTKLSDHFARRMREEMIPVEIFDKVDQALTELRAQGASED